MAVRAIAICSSVTATGADDADTAADDDSVVVVGVEEAVGPSTRILSDCTKASDRVVGSVGCCSEDEDEYDCLIGGGAGKRERRDDGGGRLRGGGGGGGGGVGGLGGGGCQAVTVNSSKHADARRSSPRQREMACSWPRRRGGSCAQ